MNNPESYVHENVRRALKEFIKKDTSLEDRIANACLQLSKPFDTRDTRASMSERSLESWLKIKKVVFKDVYSMPENELNILADRVISFIQSFSMDYGIVKSGKRPDLYDFWGNSTENDEKSVNSLN